MDPSLLGGIIKFLIFVVIIAFGIGAIVLAIVMQRQGLIKQKEALARVDESRALQRLSIERQEKAIAMAEQDAKNRERFLALSEQSLKNQEEMIRLLRKIAGEQGT